MSGASRGGSGKRSSKKKNASQEKKGKMEFTKEEIEREILGKRKRCLVCGDVARSLHFGGLSCDSCKAFFRRAVMSSAYKSFSCVNSKGQCVIDVSSRKSCQSCRFNGCQQAGMDIAGFQRVRASSSPQGNPKRPRNNPTSGQSLASSSHSLSLPSTSTPHSFLSTRDEEEILYLQKLLLDTQEKHSLDIVNTCPQEEVFYQYYKLFIQRNIAFFLSLPRCKALTSKDQSILLPEAVKMNTIVSAAHFMERNTFAWPGKKGKFSGGIPAFTASDLRKLFCSKEYAKIIHFCEKYNDMCSDDNIYILMTCLCFFNLQPGLLDPHAVEGGRIHYMDILSRYLETVSRYESQPTTFNLLLANQCLHESKALSKITDTVTLIPRDEKSTPEPLIYFKESLNQVRNVAFETLIKMLNEKLSIVASSHAGEIPSSSSSSSEPSCSGIVGQSSTSPSLVTMDQLQFLKSISEQVLTCNDAATVARFRDAIPAELLHEALQKLG